MILNLIRSNPQLRQFVRNIKMLILRIRYGLKNVDKTFYMGGRSKVCKDFVAGKYTFMNYGCDICPKVKVGAYVMFAPRVMITGSDHDINQPGTPMYFTQRPGVPETIIEDDVWLGARSIIIAGTKIGRGAVVAAGAVVTKDVEPYTIVAGVPAGAIRKRFSSKNDIIKHDEMLQQKAGSWNYCDPIDQI